MNFAVLSRLKSAPATEAYGFVEDSCAGAISKFDQYSRGIPYSALTHACSELVRVYLASTANELEDWRRRLRLALGDNARVIIDVVTELVVALGEQPEVAAYQRTKRKPASSAHFGASWRPARARKRHWYSSSTTSSRPILPPSTS